MKLQKALKFKKTLAGEIASLTALIRQKNSFTEGMVDVNVFNNRVLYDELMSKVEKMINLKIMINDANEEIQPTIYKLGEIKSLINFWQGLPVTSGVITNNSYAGASSITYVAQFTESEKIAKVKELQKLADSLQEQIDLHNFTTEIPFEIDEVVNNENTAE